MTLKEFLLDTIEYYTTDTNRRCIRGNRCQYSPVTLKLEGTSEGCAIGRHMTPENALKADQYDIASIGFVFKLRGSLLPDWMRSIDVEVLREIQDLHDTSDYWVDNGLSNQGKSALVRIVEYSKLPIDPFQKYLS